jgi:DNA-binding beta-propeller fold protein YncE
MKTDNQGNVYVISKGDYDNIPACLQCISSSTDEVVKVIETEVVGFDIYANFLYFYTYNHTTNKASFQVLDMQTETIVNPRFIDPEQQPQTPYGININPFNGDVYITDALNYTSTGDVYCFDRNGKKKFQFEAGLFPKKTIFN